MPKMFWILWTYQANHSSKPLEIPAESAEEAAKNFIATFGDDFKLRAKVYVFDVKPAFVHSGSQAY